MCKINVFVLFCIKYETNQFFCEKIKHVEIINTTHLLVFTGFSSLDLHQEAWKVQSKINSFSCGFGREKKVVDGKNC